MFGQHKHENADPEQNEGGYRHPGDDPRLQGRRTVGPFHQRALGDRT